MEELPEDPDLIAGPHWLSWLGVIAVGGFAGGLLRYAVTEPTASVPWRLLVVNTVGALLLAVLLVLVAEGHLVAWWTRPLLGTGFCGGLTTFSSIMVASDRLLAAGDVGAALVTIGLSVALGLGAVLVGLRMTRAFA